MDNAAEYLSSFFHFSFWFLAGSYEMSKDTSLISRSRFKFVLWIIKVHYLYFCPLKRGNFNGYQISTQIYFGLLCGIYAQIETWEARNASCECSISFNLELIQYTFSLYCTTAEMPIFCEDNKSGKLTLLK